MNQLPRIYGWRPDTPDHRDLMYAVPSRIAKKDLPPFVDLRPQMPPVYDQGQLGSCTANAIGAAHEFAQMKQKQPKPFVPSRLFVYYNERAMEGTVESDAGAMIRDGMKTIAQQGVCPETLWPYDVSMFAARPPQKAFKEALNHQGLKYSRIIPTIEQIMGCLAEGFPFVFGFSVYESFESAAVAKTGMMPMPKKRERCLGGHAVLAVGYKAASKKLIVRNSWSDQWGLQGYFLMPFDYVTNANLSDDFWTLRSVE